VDGRPPAATGATCTNRPSSVCDATASPAPPPERGSPVDPRFPFIVAASLPLPVPDREHHLKQS